MFLCRAICYSIFLIIFKIFSLIGNPWGTVVHYTFLTYPSAASENRFFICTGECYCEKFLSKNYLVFHISEKCLIAKMDWLRVLVFPVILDVICLTHYCTTFHSRILLIWYAILQVPPWCYLNSYVKRNVHWKQNYAILKAYARKCCDVACNGWIPAEKRRHGGNIWTDFARSHSILHVYTKVSTKYSILTKNMLCIMLYFEFV